MLEERNIRQNDGLWENSVNSFCGFSDEHD